MTTTPTRTPIRTKPWGPGVIVFGFLLFANVGLPLLAQLVTGHIR